MIYFIENGSGLIKIGFSADVETRIKSFRIGSPGLKLIGTMPGARGHERALHLLLAEYRVEGEWFQDNEHVRAAIKFAVANGVDEAKTGRTRVAESLDDSIIRAQRLADIIMGSVPRLAVEEATEKYALPAGVLYKLKYKPDNRLSVSSYFELLKGARRAVSDAMHRLADDLEFIDDIERADADQDNTLLDLQTQISRLERDLEAAKSDAAAREILAGEVRN